jgi:GT2 family glycosyltransferase
MADIKLSEITFVIPTAKDEVKTLESIPSECTVIVRRDDSQGKARNAGVYESTTEWIAFADDDIKFNKVFLDFVLQLADKNKIVGLQGYYPSPGLISRFMFFHQSVFDAIGPLKEVRHGEETEWLIRAGKAGYKLVGLPREGVYHYPHSKSTNKNEFKNLIWLLWLHPDLITRAIKTVVNKMIKSSDDVEYNNL